MSVRWWLPGPRRRPRPTWRPWRRSRRATGRRRVALAPTGLSVWVTARARAVLAARPSAPAARGPARAASGQRVGWREPGGGPSSSARPSPATQALLAATLVAAPVGSSRRASGRTSEPGCRARTTGIAAGVVVGEDDQEGDPCVMTLLPDGQEPAADRQTGGGRRRGSPAATGRCGCRRRLPGRSGPGRTLPGANELHRVRSELPSAVVACRYARGYGPARWDGSASPARAPEGDPDGAGSAQAGVSGAGPLARWVGATATRCGRRSARCACWSAAAVPRDTRRPGARSGPSARRGPGARPARRGRARPAGGRSRAAARRRGSRRRGEPTAAPGVGSAWTWTSRRRGTGTRRAGTPARRTRP